MPSPILGHGASRNRAGVGMGGEAGGTCVCLGGSSATSLHAAVQGVSVGWQSIVPPALLGTGHSEWWLFCVPEICPDIPWQVPAGSSTDQDLGPGGVVCPSLALCGQGRAHWSWGCWIFPLGLPPWCVLTLTGLGLWQLAAFWLRKGGREEGICTWNRGK